MLEYLLSSIGGLSKITTTGVSMFNRKTNEAIEILYDSIYLLGADVKELREEVDYLVHLVEESDTYING